MSMTPRATSEVPPEVFFGDDPGLALVEADMHDWLAAHPCECKYLCECDGEATAPEDARGDG